MRTYLAASHILPAVAPYILKKRLAAGKEHQTRWVEKLGRNLAPRPDGPLIWLNAVGLGEVLSLRGLIARLHHARPDARFLVTSTTATSAQVFSKNLPSATFHQFLPVDAPGPRKRFLDHFRPDLCIWAEQDLWPGFVSDLAKRHIPQAIVAARMNEKSFRAHCKAKGLYRDLYQAMDLVTAQDEQTAQHLTALGAKVEVTGSLKPAAPALGCDLDEFEALSSALHGRFVWIAAPSHKADEDVALQAHRQLCKDNPNALLIIAPRFPNRTDIGLHNVPKRSARQVPQIDDPVWLCDSFGDLGLLYRLAGAALIGGTFDATEGHNPWEAAALETAILHGPRTANFANDFQTLNETGGAITVTDADMLCQRLHSDDLPTIAQNAQIAVTQAGAQTDKLVQRLVQLVGD
ncbi:3-deoxy-D-manno-octulosonic acid transferase [Yoonia sp. BS5-3]|uniref:3-deoxy-D-manno-octulosonic acid transferase n=1 Tax=Yoonia phaeophyticola TaxID=3137369 RepID=A0ABZ2V3C6_9RHOB